MTYSALIAYDGGTEPIEMKGDPYLDVSLDFRNGIYTGISGDLGRYLIYQTSAGLRVNLFGVSGVATPRRMY